MEVVINKIKNPVSNIFSKIEKFNNKINLVLTFVGEDKDAFLKFVKSKFF